MDRSVFLLADREDVKSRGGPGRGGGGLWIATTKINSNSVSFPIYAAGSYTVNRMGGAHDTSAGAARGRGSRSMHRLVEVIDGAC